MHLSDQLSTSKEVSTASIFNSGTTKMLSMRLKEGGLLKEHSSKSAALLLCVEGGVIYRDEPRGEVKLSKGDYVNIVAEVKHSVEAEMESLLVLVKS